MFGAQQPGTSANEVRPREPCRLPAACTGLYYDDEPSWMYGYEYDGDGRVEDCARSHGRYRPHFVLMLCSCSCDRPTRSPRRLAWLC